MIKRPLDPRFKDAVHSGRKTTTIRKAPWPVGVPIMLYHWSGQGYRSPQHDVAVVIVSKTTPITIAHGPWMMTYTRKGGAESPAVPLWETEGFGTPEEMHEWFRPLVKPGKTITRHLMTFAVERRVA